MNDLRGADKAGKFMGRILAALLVVLSLLVIYGGSSSAFVNKERLVWVGTWASAQYHGDNTGDAGKLSALEISKSLPNSTLRQIVRTSLGGKRVRLTLSNEYGETPMTVNAVRIAKATVSSESDIDTSTDTAVTFNGNAGVKIQAGATVTSDPVDFSVEALERIAVSIYFGEMPETVTAHIAARANSFVQSGNVASAEILSGKVHTHWYVLCNVDVLTSAKSKSILAFGDSITDGFGVSDEQYTRWADVLMNRLQDNPDTRHLSVINMGIGTNQLLAQENPAAGIDRFERDVLEQPGAGYLVFLIGVNDLLYGSSSVEDLLAAYNEMIKKAGERGIRVFGGTIIPNSNPSQDERRQAINNWLRLQYSKGVMYGLADFEELLKDPENPQSMREIYDNDGLHPSAEGYRVMGEYVYSLIAADVLNDRRHNAGGGCNFLKKRPQRKITWL